MGDRWNSFETGHVDYGQKFISTAGTRAGGWNEASAEKGLRKNITNWPLICRFGPGQHRRSYPDRLNNYTTDMSMPSAPMLPPTPLYLRSQHELPGLLPTTAEIEAATTEFPGIFDSDYRRTVLVNGKFVVKYGTFVYENEGHALLLVEKHRSISAPRLYAMYRKDKTLYLVMEFMPGRQLSDLWPSLPEGEKLSVADQLRSIFDCARAIPSPGTFAGVRGGSLRHRYFFSLEKDPSVTGPFEKEEDLSRALALRSQRNWEMCGQRGWMSEFFARHLPSALSGHTSVFTHSDLQRKNILVREEHRPPRGPTADGRRSFKVTAILDWESDGWYPSYWEYAFCFAHFDWSDDWAEKVERILHPWHHEAAVLRMVRQDLDS